MLLNMRGAFVKSPRVWVDYIYAGKGSRPAYVHMCNVECMNMTHCKQVCVLLVGHTAGRAHIQLSNDDQ